MLRILGREGEDPRPSVNFYKAVVQATLLFDVESWVMPPWVGRTMCGFHQRVACRLAKIHLTRGGACRWICLSLDKPMKAVGLEEVETYVLRHQNTVAQYISTRLILELCLTAERRTGSQVSMRWW